MCETYENVKQTCIKRDVDVYWDRRVAWESDGDGDGHADGNQNVVKNIHCIYKSYRMCRFLPPPGRQQFFFQNLR